MEHSLLLLVHISAASLWAVSVIFLGIIVIPAVFESGPGAGPVMGNMVKRGMPQFMTVTAVLGALSGLRLYMIRFNELGAGLDWVKRPEGIVLTLASLAALHAFFKGLLVSKPLADKLGALGAQVMQTAQAGGKPSPELMAEIGEARAKMLKISRASAFELLAAFILMASHRFFAGF